MAEKFTLDNLGTIGVHNTESEFHRPKGSLEQSQNAVPDIRSNFRGVAKRDGLVAINSSAAGASITGVGYIPLTPITTRTFYIAIDQDATSSYQWVTSTTANFSVTATATSPAQVWDGDPIEFLDQYYHGRMVSTGKAIIYPGDKSTATEASPIRSWDGTTDRELARVPVNPFTNQATLYVYDMLLSGNTLYFIVHDHGASSNLRGRVMSLDLTTMVFEQIGERFGPDTGDLGGGDYIPLSLCLHNGYLFVGTGQGTMAVGATGAGVIYRIRPQVDSTWTEDETFAEEESVYSMASYKGLLYAGLTINDSAVGRLMVRSAAGAWSSSTDTGGTPSGVGNGWTALIVFGENLYACSYHNEGANSDTAVKKFDGSSWSTALAMQTNDSDPYRGVASLVHNGRLYVLGTKTTGAGSVWNTTDGSSWLDQGDNLTTGVMSRFGILTT